MALCSWRWLAPRDSGLSTERGRSTGSGQVVVFNTVFQSPQLTTPACVILLGDVELLDEMQVPQESEKELVLEVKKLVRECLKKSDRFKTSIVYDE